MLLRLFVVALNDDDDEVWFGFEFCHKRIEEFMEIENKYEIKFYYCHIYKWDGMIDCF